MNKLFNYLGEMFHKHWIKFIICFSIGTTLVVAYNSLNDSWNQLIGYCNGFFIGGLTIILIGFLALINKAGGLDIFQFMFNNKRDAEGKKETLYDYSERKRLVRSKDKGLAFPYFFVGSIFLLVSIIFYLLLPTVS